MSENELLRALVKAVLESGMTQAEICRRSGIHDHTLSLWMHGERSPRLDIFMAVLDVIGYDLQLVKKK